MKSAYVLTQHDYFVSQFDDVIHAGLSQLMKAPCMTNERHMVVVVQLVCQLVESSLVVETMRNELTIFHCQGFVTRG